MRFLEELSERGVELYENNGELLVVRNLNKEAIKNILEFYNNCSFEYKSKIIRVCKDKNFIIEDYLDGEILKNPNFIEIIMVIDSLLYLSKQKIKNISLDSYLKKSYEKKLDSLSLSIDSLLEINKIYLDIIKYSKSIFGDININLNWVHGDFKGDNIILSDNVAYFIDWEWIKKGHYIEDMQKFIQTTLKYDKEKVEYFLNNFFKLRNIDWKLFIFLETFHYFLNQILQLSKQRISLDEFKKSVENKLNLMINNNIN